MHFIWTLSHQSIHIYTDYSSIIYNDMLCLFKCWSTCAYWLFYFENLYNNWKLIAFSHPIHFLKSFEDTKLVIGSRKSKKDWQHNGLKKKDNSTNNYLPNTTLKIGQHDYHKKSEVNSGAPERLAVPAPPVNHFCHTWWQRYGY